MHLEETATRVATSQLAIITPLTTHAHNKGVQRSRTSLALCPALSHNILYMYGSGGELAVYIHASAFYLVASRSIDHISADCASRLAGMAMGFAKSAHGDRSASATLATAHGKPPVQTLAERTHPFLARHELRY